MWVTWQSFFSDLNISYGTQQLCSDGSHKAIYATVVLALGASYHMGCLWWWGNEYYHIITSKIHCLLVSESSPLHESYGHTTLIYSYIRSSTLIHHCGLMSFILVVEACTYFSFTSNLLCSYIRFFTPNPTFALFSL